MFLHARESYPYFFTLSAKDLSGNTGFMLASHPCWAHWQGSTFPSHAHETFQSLFIAAALYTADNFPRLQSTRGRGALQ